MGMNGCIFEQFEGYRLTPDNRLQIGTTGLPELYPLGHGDVGPALVENGVLDDNPLVEYAYICNVDNVMASPHPGIIGRHIRTGAPVTCEVVRRRKNDKGGCLAWVNNHLQIAEDFRLPRGFAETSRWHNTNTMIINTSVLRSEIPWRWHRVRKHIDNRIVVQYERFLQQYTEEYRSDFLEVPRDVRYCPIKEPSDLKRAGKLVSSYRFT
jgi:UDP-N-acetylglucosamine pyrophosphorylase